MKITDASTQRIPSSFNTWIEKPSAAIPKVSYSPRINLI